MLLDRFIPINDNLSEAGGFDINPMLHRPFVVRSGDQAFSCVMHAEVSSKLPDNFIPREGTHLVTTNEGRWKIEFYDAEGKAHEFVAEPEKVRNLSNGCDFIALNPIVIRESKPAIPGFVGQIIGVLGAGR
jgi:hypothetical protein